MGKNKFYVYWRADEIGLATSWDEVDRITKRVFNGRFESFDTRDEAVAVLKMELERTGRKLPTYIVEEFPALW